MALFKFDAGYKFDDPLVKFDTEAPVKGTGSMQEDNRISDEMPDADVTAVLGAIALIRSKMPWLLSISQQDRQEMAKMGEKSVGFVEKCRGYMTTNPEFLPGFIQVAEVDKDQALRVQVLRVFAELKTLFDSVGDTTMVLSGEIWMACLAYYQSVREAARRKRPGAEVIYNDLKTRFPGSKQPPENPSTPPTT